MISQECMQRWSGGVSGIGQVTGAAGLKVVCVRESECECGLRKCLCVLLYEETSVCLSH